MKILPIATLFMSLAAAANTHAQNQEAPRLFGQPQLAFAQSSFDFNMQGVGMPNCINIPLVNQTDRVRLITGLRSNIAAFSISSPAEEMLPIELQPGGTMYVSVCFRPMEQQLYNGAIIALFGSDSSVMTVSGRGIHVEPVKIPTKDELRIQQKKGASDIVLEVDLAKPTVIELVISDALGMPIKSFTYGEIKAAGPYKFGFHGRDGNGKPLKAGKYYVKLVTNDYKATKSFEITTQKRKR